MGFINLISSSDSHYFIDHEAILFGDTYEESWTPSESSFFDSKYEEERASDLSNMEESKLRLDENERRFDKLIDEVG